MKINSLKKPGNNGKSEKNNWFADRYQSVVVQRNIMLVLTVISMLGSLIAIIAVARLTPLKSVQPFLIQVEEKTGITQVVNPMTTKEITANEAITKYFAVTYIKARETYDPALLQSSYNMVRLMSSPDVFRSYRLQYNPDDDKSLLSRLGSEGRRSVEIKSVSFINESTAQVRIKITESTDHAKTEMHMVTLVTFEYAKLELTLEERYINPLGFIVKSYRMDEELVK